ncbi:hypothetical protein ART_0827 [Arthrobacter sp. PAMC 25486]|nr:hypothetical protein ART_0827 [Arthrobacter sp. PAMC 25486]
MPMGHMLIGAVSEYLGGDAGDVAIPFHLFNGATGDAPETFAAKAGERIRLRWPRGCPWSLPVTCSTAGSSPPIRPGSAGQGAGSCA